MSRTLARLASTGASLLVLLSACTTNFIGGGESCTLLACNDGVTVDFLYREKGTYAFDVTVDGLTTTCNATLPLRAASADPNDACASAGILLTRSGSALPASEQSIGGIRLTSTTVKTFTIRVTRDGEVLKERTFHPQYVVTPGPNGPDCAPKECRAVSVTFSPDAR